MPVRREFSAMKYHPLTQKQQALFDRSRQTELETILLFARDSQRIPFADWSTKNLLLSWKRAISACWGYRFNASLSAETARVSCLRSVFSHCWSFDFAKNVRDTLTHTNEAVAYIPQRDTREYFPRRREKLRQYRSSMFSVFFFRKTFYVRMAMNESSNLLCKFSNESSRSLSRCRRT